MRTHLLVATVLATTLVATGAWAQQRLTVSQYGRITATLPWAIALKKGYFKEVGIDIRDITASAGGGTSVRNMMASDLPFAEAGTAAVVAAVRSGMDLVILGAASNRMDDVAFATNPTSGITSVKDLPGKRVGFSNPRSSTEVVAKVAMAKEKLTDKVELIPLGGYGPGLTAIAQNVVAIAPLTEPQLTMQPEKYRILFHANDYLPQYTWSVQVATREFVQKEPAKVKAMLAVHRKAVDLIYKQPQEAIAVYADVWEVDKAVAAKVITKYAALKHWSHGELSKEGLDQLIDGMMTTGELDKRFDWKGVIDQSFLDEDLRRPL